jgi:outer membrane protein TolC
MLPKAVAGAGYLTRDLPNASSSSNYQTGVQTLSPSVSTDQQRRVADLSLSWNILDFGLSYFSAKQNANRALIAAERRRKAVQIAVQEVISAYWRTVAMQAISAEVALAKQQAESSIAQSNVVEQEGMRSPLEALRFQRSVLESLRLLETVELELVAAHVELGALMNLPPGTPFTVEVSPAGNFAIPEWVMPIDEMELFSLQNNPDLRDSAYQGRIAVDETRKAIVRMLPGLSIMTAPSYDSNSFLVYKNWTDAAARVSWNLFSLLSGPANISFSKSAEALTEMKRLALGMAVLTQAHIGLRQYQSALQQFKRATTIADVERRTYEVLAARGADELGRYGETIAARAAAIAADLRRYQAYAQVHMAIGKIRATLGMDLLPGDVSSIELDSLTRTIAVALDAWMDGSTPVIAPSAPVPPTAAQPVAIR